MHAWVSACKRNIDTDEVVRDCVYGPVYLILAPRRANCICTMAVGIARRIVRIGRAL